MQSHPKAQSSVEVLVLFSVLILVFVAVISTSSSIINSIDATTQNRLSRQAVDELANTAIRVYSQGLGSKEQVLVRFPESLSSADLDNNTFVIITYGSQDTTQLVEQTLDFRVIGSIPNSSGIHKISMRSLGSLVFVS